MATRNRPGFWWIYAAAWLPYYGLYLYLASRQDPLKVALVSAFNGVVPPAALGPAVFAFGRRQPWSGQRRAFIAVHGAAAIVYSVVSTAVTWGLFALRQWLEDGTLEQGLFRLQAVAFPLFMGLVFYATMAGIFQAFLIFGRLRAEEARAARAETLRTQAELRALRAQLNPHFLFNTLHTLLALVRRDARAAEEALEQFGDLLRYSLGVHQDGREDVPFAEEWEFVSNYLALEKLRLGERLRLVVEVDPGALDQTVPAFCLQPLVENAVRHAIAPRPAGGRLSIKAEVADEALSIEVRDDGPGADAEAIESSNGLGLRLVRQRLEAFYGGAATFAVVTAPGEGCVVEIRLPTGEGER